MFNSRISRCDLMIEYVKQAHKSLVWFNDYIKNYICFH
jgi:hypothetical protein